jgi:hypothetical protein
MGIKKIKIREDGVWIEADKIIVSKQPKTLGQEFKVVEVNVHVADDSKEYAGKYMKKTFWGYTDKEDAKKNKTPREQAEYFKKENDGKDILVDVTEEKSISKKDGKEYTNLKFKTLSKKEKEVAEQFIK